MEIKDTLFLLFGNKPFFEGATVGFQGRITRHVFMMAAVSKLRGANGRPRILEIGSWTGNSALTFAQGLKKFHPAGGTIVCVDPWASYADPAETNMTLVDMGNLANSGLAYELFRHNTRFVPAEISIEPMRGTSREILPRLPDKSFDMVYVDGSHYYDDVLFDLEQGARLVRDDGILCGDDLELNFGQFDVEFAKANKSRDYIADPRNGPFHPGVSLGVSDFFKRAITNYDFGFWIVRSQAGQFFDVDLGGISSEIPNHFTGEARERCLVAFGLKQN